MRAASRPLLVLLTLAALAAGLGCGSSAGRTGPPLPKSGSGGVYIALGDSFAAGNGASRPETTSYVALIAGALRDRYGAGLELRNLAAGGATTQSLIDGQLPAALDLLRQGNVRLVTITIGGNDLNALGGNATCQRDPADPACPIADILTSIEQRLDDTFQQLQQAGPNTTIAIELYPNIFSGTGHMFEQSAATAFDLLNSVITNVTMRHHVILADPRTPFNGNGPTLTHLLDPTPDPHPNDAGHRAIAGAFLKALGLPASN